MLALTHLPLHINPMFIIKTLMIIAEAAMIMSEVEKAEHFYKEAVNWAR